MSSRNQGVEKTLKRPSSVEDVDEDGAERQPERRDGIPGLVHGGQLGRVAGRVVRRA